MSAELVKRETLAEMIASYDAAKADIVEAFALIDRAHSRWEGSFKLAALYGDLHLSSHGHSHHWLGRESGPALRDLRVATWGALVERLNLRNLLSPQRVKELDADVSGDRMPEPSEDVCWQFITQFLERAGDVLAESVVHVFNALRPRPRGWQAENTRQKFKTNEATKDGVTERVILERHVDVSFDGSFQLRYDSRDTVAALEAVVKQLDGAAHLSKDCHHSDIKLAIDKLGPKNKHAETDYFKISAHASGTLHLRWKRPDLLAKFNQIAGGARLRAAS